MSEETRNVFGIRVEGEKPYKSRTVKNQLPLSDLEPYLKHALGIDTVAALRWHQYTPYFNDGDACEFTIHELEVKTVNASEDDGDYEDGFTDMWSIKYYTKEERKDFGLTPGEIDALHELNQALSGGEFYDALYDVFGDHVTVTVRRDAIELETYEHD